MEIKQNKFISIIEYTFALFLILSLNSVYFCAMGPEKNIIITCLLGVALILAIYGIYQLFIRKDRIDRLLVFFILFTVYILVLYFINLKQGTHFSLSQILVIYIFPIISLPIIYYQKKAGYSILKKLSNIIVLLSIISLIGWLLSIAGVPTNSSIMIKWGYICPVNGYFGLDFFPQDSAHFLGLLLPRNTSIFVEAPMFAYVLVIGIAIRKYFVANRSKLITLMLWITVLSTTSTTALIMLIIIYCVNYLVISSEVNSNKILKYLISIGLIIIFGIVIILLLESKQKNMTGSFNIRTDDVMAGIDAWKQHLIVGNGFNSNNVIQQFMNSNRWIQETTGYSSGIFLVLAWGGLYLFMMYISPLFMSRHNKAVLSLQIVNILLLIFVIVPMQFLYIFILMVGVGELLFKGESPLNENSQELSI